LFENVFGVRMRAVINMACHPDALCRVSRLADAPGAATSALCRVSRLAVSPGRDKLVL